MHAGPVEKPFPVGIMADSHGNAASIRSALALFGSFGCRRIFHLGDICDSLHPETVDGCVQHLKAASVTAIRGNNDHSLLANQRVGPGGAISEEGRRFLQKLPLTAEFGDARMVHSLPFPERLGLTSMIGSMGHEDAVRFFNASGRKILFRGHSHSPELIWRRGGRVVARAPAPERAEDLSERLPCIVTCGALSEGYCMIWEVRQRTVTSMRLPEFAAQREAPGIY